MGILGGYKRRIEFRGLRWNAGDDRVGATLVVALVQHRQATRAPTSGAPTQLTMRT